MKKIVEFLLGCEINSLICEKGKRIDSYQGEKEQIDYCSYWPDVLLDFDLWLACARHDFAYDNSASLIYQELALRLKADWKLYTGWVKVVNKQSKSMRHWIIGQLAAIAGFFGVRLLAWPVWYK